MSSLIAWFRRRLAWSSSRQSWQERLTIAFLLAVAALLLVLGQDRPLSQQVVFWGILVLAVAVVSRRGWLRLFGPVLFYDLVRTARRARYFLLRVLYALALFGILCWVYYAFTADQPASNAISASEASVFAATFFYTYMSVQFVILVLVTPAYVASAITDEKERRTLEFLLATDLRNREIVLSKLASRLFHLTLLLITGLPVLAGLQFLGGVDPGLVLAGFAATALTMASLAGVSIFDSTILHRSRDAIILAYLLVLFYFGLSGLSMTLLIPPGWATFSLPWTENWTNPVTVENLVHWINAGNIITVLGLMSYDVSTGIPLDQVLPGFLRNYALFHGLLALALPIWAVLRLQAIALRETTRVLRLTSRQRRQRHRPQIGRYPMLWKEIFAEGRLQTNAFVRLTVILLVLLSFAPALIIFIYPLRAETSFLTFFLGVILLAAALLSWGLFQAFRNALALSHRSRRLVAVVFFGLVLLVGLLGLAASLFWMIRQDPGFHWWEDHGEAMNIGDVRVSGTIVACLLLLAVAVRAAGSVSGERDRLTFDGLATTPLDSDNILFAKWLGAILSVRYGWLWLGALWGVGLATGALHPYCLILLVLSWLVYAAFLAGLGLYFSIMCRTTLRATLWTLLSTIGAALGHWLLLLCCFSSFMFSSGQSPDVLRWVAEFQLGFTPPLALGVLLPASLSELTVNYRGEQSLEFIGFAVLGTVCWAILAALLWVAISERFRLATCQTPALVPPSGRQGDKEKGRQGDKEKGNQ